MLTMRDVCIAVGWATVVILAGWKVCDIIEFLFAHMRVTFV